jgi:hypothetical protein
LIGGDNNNSVSRVLVVFESFLETEKMPKSGLDVGSYPFCHELSDDED